MLKDLLFSSSKKEIVGVALTPGLGLEVAVYNRGKNTVLKYGRKKVEYNFSTREIQDFVEFKSALGELVSELNIPPKASAYLVLPNVYFDFLEIPPTITDAEIQTVLLSKTEEFYIFKNEEPVSGWCNVANINDPTQKRLAFTSFQKNTVDALKDIFNDVGLQLTGIESAYSATIRGLYLVGLVGNAISKKESWTLMSINTNSFTLLYFDADNLLNFNEIPIAIKSFSSEEVYDAIISSASQYLDSFSFSKLFIISQTDDISAAKLKEQMTIENEIIAIDTNKFSSKPIVEILESTDFKLTNSMTFGVIGASNPRTELGLSTNVLSNDTDSSSIIYCTPVIFGTAVEITNEVVMKLCIFIAVVFLAIFGVIALFLHILSGNFESQVADVSKQITAVDNQITEASKVDDTPKNVDINHIIDEIAQINVDAMKFYDSISTDIPKNIWLTKYYNNNGNMVLIQGIAENITDIYEYFKNLKITSPESDIKLNELKVITNDETSELTKGLYIDSEKDRLYSFEISNTSVNYDKQGEASRTEEEDIIIKPVGSSGPVEQLSEQVKPTK